MSKSSYRARTIQDAPNWLIHELKSTRCHRAAELHASYLIRGLQPDYQQIGNIYRPDMTDSWAKQNYLKLKREPLMQDLITTKIKAALFKNEVDEDKVIQMYKRALLQAIENERPDHQMQIIDRFARMLGMDEPAQMVVNAHSQHIHLDSQGEWIKELEAERERRLAARTEDQDSGGSDGEPHLLGEADSPGGDEVEVP